MISTFRHNVIGLALAASCLYGPATLADSTGVSADRILVGQSAAFDGPAKAFLSGVQKAMDSRGISLQESPHNHPLSAVLVRTTIGDSHRWQSKIFMSV